MHNAKMIDAMMHPVRLRILVALGAEALTTQEIADRLPDVAKSSIYRHLKTLRAADLIAVSDTRQVRGAEEKRYVVARSLHLGAEDVDTLDVGAHTRLFAAYWLLVQQGFVEYLHHSAETHGRPDLGRDLAGYTEVQFHATDAEFQDAIAAMNQAIAPLLQNDPAPERRLRKFLTVTHPLSTP